MSESDSMKPVVDDNDIYLGMSWSERLRFGALGYALDPYDADGRKNRYIDSVHRLGLGQALGKARFHRALDFGCGCGRLLDELTARTDEVFGIDRTAGALDVARVTNVVPSERLALWRSGPMPFPDGYFDLIISVYVLLTPAIVAAAMREIRRVCADDASVILLEQVNSGRGLALDRYTAALASAGFFVQSTTAIRRGPRSMFLRLGTIGRWPNTFLRLIASAEAASLAGQVPNADSDTYYDYVIVARPEPTAK